MKLGLGLDLAYLLATPQWSPASVRSLAVWLTVSPQTCFQDTGLTTPCTVGSTVKGWKDASGNAINFTQSLALTTDRTMQQDAGGKYYLSLGGGANDFLGAAANALFNNAVGGCVGLACRPSVQAISLFYACFVWHWDK